MNKAILILMLVSSVVFGSEKSDDIIRELITETCTFRKNVFTESDFDKLSAMPSSYDFNNVKECINEMIDSNITDEAFVEILLSIANEEYQKICKDSTEPHKFLVSSVRILINSNSSNNKVINLIKMLYNSGTQWLAELVLDYMILKSDEWFQCSKNIIDSLNTDKYSNNSFRIKFYYDLVKLSREKQEKGAELDSIKYIMYQALVKEDWGYALDFENEYALMEPGYVKSKQRLEILKKFDNENVKEQIEIRKKEKYAERDIDLYLDRETAYKTYLKLKKGIKKLNNYTPPALP